MIEYRVTATDHYGCELSDNTDDPKTAEKTMAAYIKEGFSNVQCWRSHDFKVSIELED